MTFPGMTALPLKKVWEQECGGRKYWIRKDLEYSINSTWRCDVVVHYYYQGVDSVISIDPYCPNLLIGSVEIRSKRLNNAGIFAIMSLDRILRSRKTVRENINVLKEYLCNVAVFCSSFFCTLKLLPERQDLIFE